MHWWDERISAPRQHDLAPVKYSGESLQATVDLEDYYVRDMVMASFEKRPWWKVKCLRDTAQGVSLEASSSVLFRWGEYERFDWELVHQGQQFASCYCIRKGLIRKAHLAHNLKKWVAKHPQSRVAAALPQTLVMTLDDIDYFEEALSDVYEVRDMVEGSEVWIAKPSITNQGTGICIFDCVSTLRTALEAQPDLREWVLQRYIDRPLLVGGRKFHIRAYALCVGSLKCFVFSQMLALFAGRPYQPGFDNLDNLKAHLTNTCCLEQSGSEMPADAVKLVSELPEELEKDGLPLKIGAVRVAKSQQDVRDIIGSCIEAVSSELTFFTLPNCFELFGFDLLLDETWNVWLLEANAEPDMKQTGSRLREMIASLVEGIMQLAVDPIAAEKGCYAEFVASSLESEQFAGEWIKVFDKQTRVKNPEELKC